MHFLGKNLRYLRKQSSKTQSEIAALINKGQTTVGNWENGISEPNLDELIVISNYFDISLDILLKNDLANLHHSQRQGSNGVVPYDHTPDEPSVIRDRDERLSYALQEIRILKEEMEQIQLRLPKL